MNAATMAIEALLVLLGDAGIEAKRDPGAFFPQPLGVLVGLPSHVGGTLGARTYTIPIYVVSGEPLSTTERVDDLYDLADRVSAAVDANGFEPYDFRGTANNEPLPAVRLTAVATVPIPVTATLEG